ncbi:TetR-like C-terminal domain-containing protein [Acrocarpospora corrugata]
MRSMLHGFSNLEAAGGFAHARPADASWTRCLDALHPLLERWPASQ